MSKELTISEERKLNILEEKFQIKPAHEKDITGLTRMLYISLHIGGVLAILIGVWQMPFGSKLEKFIAIILFGFLAALNEVFKSKKMEDYATLKLLSDDEDLNKEKRIQADNGTPKAFLFVSFFLLVSILSVGFFGFKFGESKTNAEFKEIPYDANLKKQAENSILAIENAIKSGYSQRSIKALTTESQTAVKEWNTHKLAVDTENKTGKEGTEENALIMGLVYFLIGFAYEVGLYKSRMWHEKEEYAVLKSKLKASKKRRETGDKDGDKNKKNVQTSEEGNTFFGQSGFHYPSYEVALSSNVQNSPIFCMLKDGRTIPLQPDLKKF